MKTPFTIRVEQVDMEAWVRASNRAGMTISEWARRALNAKSQQAVPDGESATPNPTHIRTRPASISRATIGTQGGETGTIREEDNQGDLNAAGDGQNVRRVPDVPAMERRAAVAREPRAKPEPVPTAPLFTTGAHPGAGVFNAANDLSEPAYKTHEADCRCMICESAIKAGLKEDPRPKKTEEKKPAKRGRR